MCKQRTGCSRFSSDKEAEGGTRQEGSMEAATANRGHLEIAERDLGGDAHNTLGILSRDLALLAAPPDVESLVS